MEKTNIADPEIIELMRSLNELGQKWGLTPIVLASCQMRDDGEIPTDAHIQIWHPLCFEYAPCYIVFPDGRWEEHPDAPWDHIIPCPRLHRRR